VSSLKPKQRHTAILGDQELAPGEVTLKDMRGGEQRSVAEDNVVAAVAS